MPWTRGAARIMVDETTGAVPLNAVTADRVRWLWPARIPIGKLTLLDGDPDLGKSALMLDIAARITRGTPLPDGSRPDFDGPAGVVLLCSEDGLADTIIPRLQAAGADLDRVIALRGVWNGVRLRWVRLPRDTREIATAVRDVRARLVVIDPLMAYLDPSVNAYREQSIRGVLGLLGMTAERLDLALVIVRHLIKGTNGNPLYRGGGSIGVIGAARSGLVVGADPHDPTGRRRVLAVAKGNLTAPPPSLAYTLETVTPAPPLAAAHPSLAADAPPAIAAQSSATPRKPPAPPAQPAPTAALRVAWAGPVPHTAAALLARAADPAEGADRDARAEAIAFLQALLADGPVPARTVFQAARQTGLSVITVRRAKLALRVVARKESDGRWSWTLP